MLNQDQLQALKAPFPPQALSKDTSRGFELTSIKAAYVIERLNDVFGTCGVGWRYVHSPFEAFTGKYTEIITEVVLQYRFKPTNDCTGCDKIVWSAETNDWAFRNGSSNHDWSEPIFACGGKQVASDGKASATAFWTLYRALGAGGRCVSGICQENGGDGRLERRLRRTRHPDRQGQLILTLTRSPHPHHESAGFPRFTRKEKSHVVSQIQECTIYFSAKRSGPSPNATWLSGNV